MGGGRSLALILRGLPYHGRAPRADLDMALAAAALDREVEIYLLGPALLQLAAQRAPEAAELPVGYRAWAALPELGEVTLFAEQGWVDRCAEAGIELLLPVQGLAPDELAKRWRRCRQVLAA